MATRLTQTVYERRGIPDPSKTVAAAPAPAPAKTVAAPAKAAAAPTTTATAAPTKTLASVYDQYLGRAPDAAGAQYWNQQLASGSSLADV